MESIITYVLAAMLSWVPIQNLTPYGESEAEARVRLRAIATDIVTVAFDPAEPPVFAGADGRIKTSLLHAAIASMEGGFQKFIEDGACNKPGYAGDRRGNCDGGHAWSLWQIHIFGNGYLFMADGSLSSVDASPDYAREHPDEIVRGPQIISDRMKAVRLAQRLERSSIKRFNSLCAYTGECDNANQAKAVVRLDRAKNYFAHHPYVAPPDPTAEVVLNFLLIGNSIY